MHPLLLVAPMIMIVQIILHVKTGPASIPVLWETLVQQLPIAVLPIISLFVLAQTATLDHQPQIVDCVSLLLDIYYIPVQCMSWFFISAPQPECRTDPECADHLACIREECLDPCTTLACGVNAQCSVKRHRATCTCRRGFIGDPFRFCEERKMISLLQGIPLIRRFFILAGCKSDDECPLTEACFDRECRDPCLFQECGENAVCTARLHQAFCQCKEGYRGNPYDRCRQYECLIDSDCRNTLKCENEKCVDPCACAQFADCTPRNHRGICTCFPDYTGNPYGIACDPSKIFTLILLKNWFRLMIVFSSTWASCGRPRVQYWCWMS